MAIMHAFCFNTGRNRAKQHSSVVNYSWLNKNMKDLLLNCFILTIYIAYCQLYDTCALPQFAPLSGTSTQLLPPKNGAIVPTDSVCTQAYLQNFETCMRNLHWSLFHKKCMRIINSGKGDLHTKLMLAYSVSRFMQQTCKKWTLFNSSILIMCVLILTRQDMCIQPSMTFKIWFRGLSKLHV